MLRRRIHQQAANQRGAQARMTAMPGPVPTGPMTGQHPAPGGVPATLPAYVVSYFPWADGNYGTLVAEEAEIMQAADGAIYLGGNPQAPSSGAVVAAGNPRQGAASETKARAQYAAPAFTPGAAGPRQSTPFAADGAPYSGTTQPVYRGPGA